MKPTSDHPLAHLMALQLPDVIPHPAIAHRKGVVHEPSTRVARSLEGCKNSGRFAKDDWWKRTSACIDTTASLVFGAGANLTWFGDIRKLLGDIGVEKPRELSLAGIRTDQVFVVHWSCLSLVVIQQILEGNRRQVRHYGNLALQSLAVEDNIGIKYTVSRVVQTVIQL
jgi:hypothetical protein